MSDCDKICPVSKDDVTAILKAVNSIKVVVAEQNQKHISLSEKVNHLDSAVIAISERQSLHGQKLQLHQHKFETMEQQQKNQEAEDKKGKNRADWITKALLIIIILLIAGPDAVKLLI